MAGEMVHGGIQQVRQCDAQAMRTTVLINRSSRAACTVIHIKKKAEVC